MEDMEFSQFKYYNPGENPSALASEELLKEIGVDIRRFLEMPKEEVKPKPSSISYGGMMMPSLPSLA